MTFVILVFSSRPEDWCCDRCGCELEGTGERGTSLADMRMEEPDAFYCVHTGMNKKELAADSFYPISRLEKARLSRCVAPRQT